MEKLVVIIQSFRAFVFAKGFVECNAVIDFKAEKKYEGIQIYPHHDDYHHAQRAIEPVEIIEVRRVDSE